MRIVSLVPSLTSTLCAVGLRSQIVGCTKFCVVPADLHRDVTLVGGTKDPDIAAIRALRPTHILVNEEENTLAHVEEIRGMAATLVTFPKGPEDVPGMLREMGAFFGSRSGCDELADRIDGMLASPAPRVSSCRYIYMIWQSPYMTISNDTYIARCLDRLGWVNAIGEESTRYPQIEVAEIDQLQPDRILLATEPYPFRARDAGKLREQLAHGVEILRIDGRLTQWYGDLTADLLLAMQKKDAGYPAFCSEFSGGAET